jgi:hypothetical protein
MVLVSVVILRPSTFPLDKFWLFEKEKAGVLLLIRELFNLELVQVWCPTVKTELFFREVFPLASLIPFTLALPWFLFNRPTKFKIIYCKLKYTRTAIPIYNEHTPRMFTPWEKLNSHPSVFLSPPPL